MKFTLISLLILAMFPLFVFAHGSAYIDFSPDTSQALDVSGISSIAQIFVPQNEYLGAVDLWTDGSAGNLSIEIRTESGTLLSSKTVAVPNIPAIDGGQKVHIDLNGQLSVISNQNYRLVIVSNPANFRIHYSDRILFSSHNAPQGSAYVNGVAEVDGQEQDYSFKFALYEFQESTPPVISNVSAVVASPYQTRLEFNSNEAVDYKAIYGIAGSGTTMDTSFTGSYIYCGSEKCTVTIDTLPDSSYNFTITAKDIWGNQSNATGTFNSGGSGETPTATPTPTESVSATPPPLDSTPPIITNLRISEIQPNFAKFAWTTDEAANSGVVVQTLPDLITAGANNDNALELEHLVQVSNLINDTLYRAKITSYDSSNNMTIQTLDFSTPPNQISPLPQTPTPPPDENEVVVEEGEENETVITWQDTAEGFYRVDIFDNNNNLIHTENVTTGNKISVRGLPESYRVIVYENKNGVYEKIAAPIKHDRRSMLEKLFAWLYKNILYIAGAVVVIITGLVFYLKHSSNKKPTISPPTQENGAQSSS